MLVDAKSTACQRRWQMPEKIQIELVLCHIHHKPEHKVNARTKGEEKKSSEKEK